MKNKHLVAILVVVGVLATIIDLRIGFTYAACGMLILSATQVRVVMRQKSGWWIFGGNPFDKLDETESSMAAIGLAMLLSVSLTFFVKVLWLRNAVL